MVLVADYHYANLVIPASESLSSLGSLWDDVKF